MPFKLLSTSPLEQRAKRLIECYLSWANGTGTDLVPDATTNIRLRGYGTNVDGFLRQCAEIEAHPDFKDLHGSMRADIGAIRRALSDAKVKVNAATDPDAHFNRLPADRRAAVAQDAKTREDKWPAHPKELKHDALQHELVRQDVVAEILEIVKVE